MQLAVFDRPEAHPGIKHGANRAPELLLRILRERAADRLLDGCLVQRNQRFPVSGGQIGILDKRLLRLVVFENILEMIVLHAEHHIRIHGDEAAVAVEGEAAVAGAGGNRLDGDVIEAEIEHGVHHARHRGAGA